MSRPVRLAPRERLIAALRRLGPCGSADLARDLDVSKPTLLRMLAEQSEAVVAGGAVRHRRYAALRALRGEDGRWPIFAIDREGRNLPAGELASIQPEGTHCVLDASAWPVPEESRDGWSAGLPYPLVDMRPQGFMGRNFARVHAEAIQLEGDPRVGRTTMHCSR